MELTREQVERLAEYFQMDILERHKKQLLAHDQALREQLFTAQEQLRLANTDQLQAEAENATLRETRDHMATQLNSYVAENATLRNALAEVRERGIELAKMILEKADPASPWGERAIDAWNALTDAQAIEQATDNES